MYKYLNQRNPPSPCMYFIKWLEIFYFYEKIPRYLTKSRKNVYIYHNSIPVSIKLLTLQPSFNKLCTVLHTRYIKTILFAQTFKLVSFIVLTARLIKLNIFHEQSKSLKGVGGNNNMGCRDNQNLIRRSVLPNIFCIRYRAEDLTCESTKAGRFYESNRSGQNIVKCG